MTDPNTTSTDVRTGAHPVAEPAVDLSDCVHVEQHGDGTSTVTIAEPRHRPFLATLEADAEARAMFVEDLRAAASLLDRTRIETWAPEIAARLRTAAQHLCDHTRTGSDGRCRYCEASAGLEGAR